MSFEADIFPIKLQTAKVLPIKEKGARMNPTGFRTISILISFFKVILTLLNI